LHDGEALKTGVKYLMRADLVYKCREEDLNKLEGSNQYWDMEAAK